MRELLISIVSGLVEKPEEITVTADDKNEEGVIVYHLHVSEDDIPPEAYPAPIDRLPSWKGPDPLSYRPALLQGSV